MTSTVVPGAPATTREKGRPMRYHDAPQVNPKATVLWELERELMEARAIISAVEDRLHAMLHDELGMDAVRAPSNLPPAPEGPVAPPTSGETPGT